MPSNTDGGAHKMARTSICFMPPCTGLSMRNVTLKHTTFIGSRMRVIPQRRVIVPKQQQTPCITTTTMTIASRSGKTLVEGMITLFPIWAIGASLLAYQSPHLFIGIGPLAVRLALAGVMLSTGLTLTRKELSEAAARPAALSIGLIGCFIAMPGIAFMLAKIFALSGAEKAGLLLLGVVSGGQMSNLCTHISRGDTALSVAMTTASTLAAAFALPMLAKLLLQATVPVDAMALAVSTASFVLAPVLLGAALSGVAKPIRHTLPLIGIALVLVLIVGPVAQTAAVIAPAFRALAIPVILLHIIGGALGYLVSKCFGRSEAFARAMAFETGFKSPALSFVLAQAHFADPGVAMASAVSIVTLAPLGALFAVVLRFFPPKTNDVGNVKSGATPVSVRARRLKVNGGGGGDVKNVEQKGEKIDTKKLRLDEKEELKVDEMEKVEWRNTMPTSAGSDGSVPPSSSSSPLPNEKTKFRIFVRNRKSFLVHFGALAAKLKLLRKRGFVITQVQRIDGVE